MVDSSRDSCTKCIQESDTFIKHENQLQQQPYDVPSWLLYLDSIDDVISSQGSKEKDQSSSKNVFWEVRDVVGRRSLVLLPRSYKLWKNHWEFILQGAKQNIFTEADVLVCFERCLWTLSSYPRVWVEYITFLRDHPGCTTVTNVRRIVNRALQSLPVSQHEKVWPVILEWIHSADKTEEDSLPSWRIPLESRVRVIRRYCLFNPLYRSEFAEFLVKHERWGEAAIQYQHLLNALSAGAETQRDSYWQAFSELCTQHPLQVEDAGVAWEEILRAVLIEQRTSGEKGSSSSSSSSALLEGMLWTQLADSWIRRGSFDIARSVYEEGLQTVRTVRDFSILYDAYLQFEEGLLEAATSTIEDDDMETDEATQQDGSDDWDILLEENASSKLADMELAVARAEHLTSRRPLLLNAVVLRQSPHSIGDWLRRAELYIELELSGQAIAVLEEALQSTDPNRTVNGRPSELVLKLGEIYENQDLDKAEQLFDRICRKLEYKFQKADDLSECWAAWVEMALRHEHWDEALSLARQAVAPGAGPRKLNLTKSVRLWDLLLDLEESLGTLQTAKDAYKRVMEIKAATVQQVLNFASFLNDREYFEESFAAYEKGIELFSFPHPGAKMLWTSYLTSFTNRYGGAKVERTRDIFQRCLEDCPAEDSSEFFLMDGSFEESYGLVKRALSVYQAMCRKVPHKEKFLAYRLFITKTTKYLGVTPTRDIYQEAIDTLKDQEAARICIDFAKMETELQEFERARAILAYGAQMADPRRLPEYWKSWNEFEISHGNEETFREMLRVKRSVEAAFSTINYNATGLNEKVDNLTDEQAMKLIAEQEGVDRQPETKTVEGFVPSSRKRPAGMANLDEVEARVAQLRKVTGENEKREESDNEEIDIDEIDAEIEEAAALGAQVSDEKESGQGVETKAVPKAVFGGLQSES